MKSFTDRQGRSWTIEINYTSLRRVHALTGINLTRIVDPKANVMEQLTGDPFVLFDCLIAILQPQLDDKDVTAEQFGEALDEESGDKASMALISERSEERSSAGPCHAPPITRITAAHPKISRW